MATPDLIQLSTTGTYTVTQSGTTLGFPLSPATFRYALFSFWVCLGIEPPAAGAIQWNCPYVFFAIRVDPTSIRIILTSGLSHNWFDGTFNYSISGSVFNVQISVDGVAGTVQVYANDTHLTLSSGGLTGTNPPGLFQMTNLYGIWQIVGTRLTGGVGVGDVYLAAPSSFYDLTVTANRRKFQNADFSPVDLGATATSVLGTAPQIYLTARGNDPANFRLNNGFGGPLVFYTGYAPAMLAAGTCTIPWPPPAPPKLAMDNVIVTAVTTQMEVNLISLRWSDDRGHSWGSAVTQDIGEAGEYRTSLQWQRCGFARDRVWEISWSVPMRTALQGAWIDVTPAQS